MAYCHGINVMFYVLIVLALFMLFSVLGNKCTESIGIVLLSLATFGIDCVQ